MEFQLKAEFIELDNALKVMNLVSSGAEAKQRIQSGLVKINREAETRIRRKLRLGDFVEFGEYQIRIV
ncbi:MAG: RNA-binding S4 domain-containing protein [Candidatus Omnitrophota bacterium]|nr:RNA-binding S4 domain-containing protein [Candidatus Omnitrophota bacterium]